MFLHTSRDFRAAQRHFSYVNYLSTSAQRVRGRRDKNVKAFTSRTRYKIILESLVVTRRN